MEGTNRRLMWHGMCLFLFGLLTGSEDIKVMSGNDLAVVEFADFFQYLLLTARLPTLLSPRLVATGVAAVI